MTQAQMIEGTTEEITQQLQRSYAGQKLRVFVELETEEDDLTVGLAAPPFTVRDQAHLIELLLEGVSSPTHEVTEAAWERLHERVHNHPNPGKS